LIISREKHFPMFGTIRGHIDAKFLHAGIARDHTISLMTKLGRCPVGAHRSQLVLRSCDKPHRIDQGTPFQASQPQNGTALVFVPNRDRSEPHDFERNGSLIEKPRPRPVGFPISAPVSPSSNTE
jgi:hypothetical protein